MSWKFYFRRREGITSTIYSLVKDIDGLLKNQLDMLAKALQPVQQVFVLDYNNARIIVDLKKRQAGNSEDSPDVLGEQDDGV